MGAEAKGRWQQIKEMKSVKIDEAKLNSVSGLLPSP